MRKLILIIFLFFTSSVLLAQGSFTSVNGLFTVNYLKGCASTEIEVSLNTTTGTPFLCFDADLSNIAANGPCFGGPVQNPADFRFTYNQTGTYKILFLQQLTNSQLYDSLTIEILDPKPPFISFANCNSAFTLDLDPMQDEYDNYEIDFGDGNTQVYSVNAFPITYAYADPSQLFNITVTGEFNSSGYNNCGNNSYSAAIVPQSVEETSPTITDIELLTDSTFQVDFELNTNQSYELQIKENENGTYRTVATFEGDQADDYVFSNRNLQNSFYCVRLLSTSVCTGTDLFSNEVCTIKFSGDADIDGNILSWNYSSFQNAELFKNGALISSENAAFLDGDVFCGQVSDYKVVTTDANGLQIESLPVQVVAIGGAPLTPISQIAINVVSDSELELSWEVPQGLQPTTYVIYRKQRLEQSFSEIDTTINTTYVDDNGIFNDNEYYYSIAYENDCGDISSLETTASNILLKLRQEEATLNLEWNLYTGFDSLFKENILVKYDDNMNVLEEIPVGEDTLYIVNTLESTTQLAFYQIQAFSENGLIASSNIIEYKIPSSFFVPSAFTPNGDGQNEEIKVVGKFIDQVEFSIYNRWGTLIFRSNELGIGWSGFLTEREAPEGTYSYTVRVKDQYGEEYYKSGTFNLIR